MRWHGAIGLKDRTSAIQASEGENPQSTLRPSLTPASSTNSPPRCEISPGGCVADPLAELASDVANQGRDASAQVTPGRVQEETEHNSRRHFQRPRLQTNQDATEQPSLISLGIGALQKLPVIPINLLPAAPKSLFIPCSRIPLSWVPTHQTYHSRPCLAAASLSPVVGASPRLQSQWRLPSLLKIS